MRPRGAIDGGKSLRGARAGPCPVPLVDRSRPLGHRGVGAGRVREVRLGGGAARPPAQRAAALGRVCSTAGSPASIATSSTWRPTSRCPTLVVAGDVERDWSALGATAVLGPSLTRGDLLEALSEHATPINRVEQVSLPDDEVPATAGFRGRLIAVTGRGGTGRSTLAMALAQGLGADLRYSGTVCLADLVPPRRPGRAARRSRRRARRAGARRGPPQRHPAPRATSARSTFDVPSAATACCSACAATATGRPCGPAPCEAALDGLRRAFRLVVADVDADFEGEAETRLDRRRGAQRAGPHRRRAADARRRRRAAGAEGPARPGPHGRRRARSSASTPAASSPSSTRRRAAPRARAELTRAFADAARRRGDAGGRARLPRRPATASTTSLRDSARLPSALGVADHRRALAALDRARQRHDRPRRPAGPRRSPRDPRDVDGRRGGRRVRRHVDDYRSRRSREIEQRRAGARQGPRARHRTAPTARAALRAPHRRRGRPLVAPTTSGACGRSTSPIPSWSPSGRSATSPATARWSRCSPTTTSGRS